MSNRELQAHGILEQHIVQRIGHVPEHLDQVLTHFEWEQHPRYTHLLQAGEICRKVYFIVKGCVQVYVIDGAGEEATREVHIEEQWLTDIIGFQQEQPAQEYFKCLEKTTVLSISRSSFALLNTQVPTFGQIYKQILELSYNNAVYRLNSLNSLDAKGKIQWMQRHKPKLMQRLPSRMIASYIGISPETYSRLKRLL